MQPFTLFIFGVTGNLASLKVLPALYDLAASGLLPDDVRIVGVARRAMSADEFISYVEKTIHTKSRHHDHDIDPTVWGWMKERLSYIDGDFSSPKLYEDIDGYLKDQKTANRIFYLATYPDLYKTIFDELNRVGLSKPAEGWMRLMIEKPIGTDLPSAKALNELLGEYFTPDQVFRLDHYLGKETLQNILTFRFGNGLFEPLFTKEHIDHVQITAAEEFGIGKRGGYYDAVGALKDVGQNHILQMLTLALMENPGEFTNEAVTAARVALLAALKPDPASVVFGQYDGYQQEFAVKPNSDTDTFFAFKTMIDTPRFEGVPVYVRAGKMMEQTVTEISIVFKVPVNRLFADLDCGKEANVLVFRIQPNEGIVLRILSKKPGHTFELEQTYMQFCYRNLAHTLPDAYERLFADAISGDQTFFNDPPEVELQWAFIDPLFAHKTTVHPYKQGSWGPSAADELIAKDERAWLVPSPAFCAL